MEQNTIRSLLTDRLDVADLVYDIKRLTAELNYHKSKVQLFTQALKAQQEDLSKVPGNLHDYTSKEDYK